MKETTLPKEDLELLVSVEKSLVELVPALPRTAPDAFRMAKLKDPLANMITANSTYKYGY
ncbi:hypothetical protein EON63_11700 [archaeon]|nr:MAG: hypothetical protein EON63_11700 [archaeon]